MHLSVNQIRTTALKACVGAGVRRGVAEDIADGCVALIRAGVDPTDALISAINEFKSDNTPAKWIENSDLIEASNTSILSDGPSIVDLVQVGRTVKGSTDEMLLLLGLLLRRISEFEIAIAVDDQILDAENINAIANDFAVDAERRFSINLAEQDCYQALAWKTPELPSQENWNKLYKLSEAILVPADPESRADAGAGSTDND